MGIKEVRSSMLKEKSMMRLVTVYDLSTGDELSYTCDPISAIVTAFAQSVGDYNTWSYEKYMNFLRLCGEDGLTLSLGDMALRLDESSVIPEGGVQ